MRIGIDARFFGPKQKGLGRYSQKLIENLERIEAGSENEYYIFLRREGFDSYQPQNKNFKKVLAEYRWYGWSEQLLFPRLLNKYNLDLVHFCHFNVPIFYRKKFVVTIHDLILFHFPTIKNSTLNTFHYFFKLRIYHFVIRQAVQRAEKIIAVSEFTKKDIQKELKIPENKILVTKEGFDPLCRTPSEKPETILKKYGIIKPYLLYVGNAYPHKNLEMLCRAFAGLKREYPELKLVLVGGEDYFYNRLEKYVKELGIKGVIFPGFVPDEELGVVYKGASVYVFPSLYEGFGLPPLEALAENVPVASSNRTSMPEVLGEAAQYFNPEEGVSVIKNISELLGLKDRRAELLKEGQAQLKKFSWQKMAAETLEAYKKIVG